MRECKKCGSVICGWAIVDGKERSLRTRKYCLICSPFGQGNNRKLELPASGRNKRHLFKTKRICSLCKREKTISNVNSVCSSCKGELRRNSHKKMAIKMLGGRCRLCGYERCQKAFHFHHVDPKMKKFAISNQLHLAWPRLEEELRKCVLVCSRCHAEIHDGMISKATVAELAYAPDSKSGGRE